MTVQTIPRIERGSIRTALVLTRREIHDNLRDWRIVTPIILLTLLFPFLMDFTSRWATNWVSQFTDPILVERINPFLLLVVGFFPISFSLIIALESFVGEKERNSIEPILSMPVSDLELYLGKMLSSLLLPLLAAYLGITVFLIMRLTGNPPWIPGWELTVLMFLLTTAEALVMVSGAVVVSSQTTSVRAANLLASFIIIPMALLIQVEAVVMFYAEYTALWWFVAGLMMVNIIFIRMGARIFNREDILSKQLDELSLKKLWKDFVGYFLRPPDLAAQRNRREAARFNVWRFYRHDIPLLLKQQDKSLLVVTLVVMVAVIMGIWLAQRFPIPREAFPLDNISADTFAQVQRVQLLPEISTVSIFVNNVRTMILAAVTSIFSFGALPLILVLINGTLVSYLISQIVMLGFNPWVFAATFILPHGILEIPAVIIGFTFAVRIGVGFISPPEGLDVGQGLLLNTANFVKVLLFLVIPVLLVAAYIEANITPQIVLAVYAGN
jgi:uncharacterized membrane protein SpoIIM required for sporulation/ABC-type transport system involved in multi-copper enzyme maturation permease subunit